MVNITSLEKNIRFIDGERNIGQMKKWSERFREDNMQVKSWYIKQVVRKIKRILVLISCSVNDIVEMLKGFLLLTEYYKLIGNQGQKFKTY